MFMESLTIKDIPDEVMLRSKAWAALHNTTMSPVVIDFMKEQGIKLQLRTKVLMAHSSVDTAERMYVHAPPTPEEVELSI